MTGERLEPIRHIRDVRRTREELGYVGKELPATVYVAWCGASNEGFDFLFLDESHAITHLKHDGSLTPCPACLRAIRDVIDAELRDRGTAGDVPG